MFYFRHNIHKERMKDIQKYLFHNYTSQNKTCFFFKKELTNAFVKQNWEFLPTWTVLHIQTELNHKKITTEQIYKPWLHKNTKTVVDVIYVSPTNNLLLLFLHDEVNYGEQLVTVS